MRGFNLCLRGLKGMRRPILYVRGTTAGLKQDSESLLVLQAALEPLYGFQNLYLRLEYSSVARAIEHQAEAGDEKRTPLCHRVVLRSSGIGIPVHREGENHHPKAPSSDQGLG